MNCLVYIGSYSIFFANCRILRGRALYKVTCDFVDAAVKGAVGVINRCIPPINPTDPECFHMWVNIMPCNCISIIFLIAPMYLLSALIRLPDKWHQKVICCIGVVRVCSVAGIIFFYTWCLDVRRFWIYPKYWYILQLFILPRAQWQTKTSVSGKMLICNWANITLKRVIWGSLCDGTTN
jgi:hypothetical protein